MTLTLARPPTIAGPETMPATWARRLAGYAWEKQPVGKSQASTFRLTAPGKPTLFVKAERSGLFCEIMNEANRLRWMGEQGLPCPQVLALEAIGGWHWLLMSALEGDDLSRRGRRLPNEIIELAVAALKRLHAMPVESCPFDHRLGRRLADARSRVAAGRVDPREFDVERRSRTPAQLLDELLARRPPNADRVVTHFGFFCRRELELEKTIRLPLRFRQGSLEYCNRLEGK